MTDALDWHQVATYAGYGLMAVLSTFATKIWRDVEKLKDGWLTREEFNKKIEGMETERDKRHTENTGRFDEVRNLHYQGQIAIERRLGELAAKIAELRPQPPHGTPERRRGY